MLEMRMSITPERRPGSAPHVVVVGNHKGGSGKSTVAMHVIIALLKAGKRVASFDFDVNQQTLTHYIENRREWARQNDLVLELPDHCPIAEEAGGGSGQTDAVYLDRFISQLRKLGQDRSHDFIVIDTPAGTHQLSLVAHGMADTIVTPINDSLVDLDAIVAIEPNELEPRPSRYAGTVGRAREARRNVCGRVTDWIVVPNRLARLSPRVGRQVDEILESVHAGLGFRTARGLSERAVYREFFGSGLTAFDPIERPVLGVEPNPANFIARQEVRDLVEQIGLLPRQAMLAAVGGEIRKVAPADGTRHRLEALRPRGAEPTRTTRRAPPGLFRRQGERVAS